jgi:hypothetical protein
MSACTGAEQPGNRPSDYRRGRRRRAYPGGSMTSPSHLPVGRHRADDTDDAVRSAPPRSGWSADSTLTTLAELATLGAGQPPHPSRPRHERSPFDGVDFNRGDGHSEPMDLEAWLRQP